MGIVTVSAAIAQYQRLEEGAQRHEDDDEDRQHHDDLVDMGTARQAEKGVKNELPAVQQHQAGDEEQHEDAEQVPDKRDRAQCQRRDCPDRILPCDTSQVADRAAELAQPLHVSDLRARRYG